MNSEMTLFARAGMCGFLTAIEPAAAVLQVPASRLSAFNNHARPSPLMPPHDWKRKSRLDANGRTITSDTQTHLGSGGHARTRPDRDSADNRGLTRVRGHREAGPPRACRRVPPAPVYPPRPPAHEQQTIPPASLQTRRSSASAPEWERSTPHAHRTRYSDPADRTIPASGTATHACGRYTRSAATPWAHLLRCARCRSSSE